MKRLLAGLLIGATVSVCAQAQTLHYALPFNAENEYSRIAVEWGGAIKKATNGEVVIEPAMNGSLVSIVQTLDGVRDGVVPIGMTAVSFMSGTIPAFGFPEMIGGTPSADPATTDALKAMWPHIDALLSKHGVKPMWATMSFYGGVLCRQGFLKGAKDWTGKKIRAAGRWQSKQVTAMGATPVPMPTAELYLALQNGVVDCALMLPTIALAARFYEVAPYYTSLNMSTNVGVTIMSQDAWNRLTEHQRTAITKISNDTNLKAVARLRNMEKEQLDRLGEKGKVYFATEAERAEFLKKTKVVFDEVAASAGSGPGKALIDVLAKFQ